jgi:tetratricopeptide (TPR) repeat protein
MKRFFYLILVFQLIHPASYSQTDDRKAFEYYNHGVFEVSRKNFRQAVLFFDQALERDSGFLQAYENRGVAKYYLEEYGQALDDFNKALKINPEDYNTYGRRGWSKYHLNDLPGAISDFTKALEGVKDKGQYFNVRGESEYRLQDYHKAMADFTRVIRFWYKDRDERSNAFYWRGLTEIDLGEKENGCLDLNKAVKLGNEKAVALIKVYCKEN